MKKIIFIVVCAITSNLLNAMQPTTQAQDPMPIMQHYYNQLYAYMQQQTGQSQTDTLRENRDQLDRWAYPKQEPKDIKEKQIINTARYVLAFYKIVGVGGPQFTDDGVRMLQELLETYFKDYREIPTSLKKDFFINCNFFLNYALKHQARDSTINIYTIYYTLAYLYQLKTNVHSEPQAIDYLIMIIRAFDEIVEKGSWSIYRPVDIALCNKARVLLAKIYLNHHDQIDTQNVQKLLQAVVQSSFQGDTFIGNSTKEDADFAKAALMALQQPKQHYNDPRKKSIGYL